MQPTDLNSPLTDAELDELDALLLGLDADTAMLNVSELDGFLTAVVSGPEMVPPSEWLPVIWGGEAHTPVWDDVGQFQRVFGLLIRHMNSTSATLMQAPEHFEALFGQRIVAGKQNLIVDEWCLGYMKGVVLRAEAWRYTDDEFFSELLGPIPLFSGEEGWKVIEHLNDDEVRGLQLEIEPAVRAIHAFWLSQRTPVSEQHPPPGTGAAMTGTFRREAPKVGRNDPCPCDSGRKYKRCCGAH